MYNPNQPRASDGKWAGAGGAAGEHSAGVNAIGKNLISDKVLDVIRNNPRGSSVTLSGETPTKGYMVAREGFTRYVDTKDLTGRGAKEILNEYAAKNKALLMRPGAHIGVWNDPASGKTHLDVANNMPRQREAVATGRKENQISIWDVKRKQIINTGGKGD